MPSNVRQRFSITTELALALFKIRNEGSYLGVIWYLLNPLLMFITLYFVFSGQANTHIQYYSLYLFVGIIQWNYLNNTIIMATENVVRNPQLLKSISFPRDTLVLSGVLLAFLTHLFELLLLLCALIYFGRLTWLSLLFPLVMALQTLFLIGLSMILSSLTVFVRDLEHLWAFTSRLWWFLTPIFYLISEQKELLGRLNLLNPMFYAIDISRDVLIYQRVPGIWNVLALCAFSIMMFCAGILVFGRIKDRLAERA